MSEYKKTSNGRYMVDGKLATADSVPRNVRDALETVDSGTALDENGEDVSGDEDMEDALGNASDKVDEDESLDDDEEEEAKPKASTRAKPKASARQRQSRTSDVDSLPQDTPQSEPGMGFPRVNGKTVDAFDGKTPHTHVKSVNGIMVPLSEENYHNKTDDEILKQIDKLGI